MKLSISTCLFLLLGSATALDKIIVKGSKFFNSKTGSEFFVKGIAYQPEKGDPDPGNQDPLADPVGCSRDAPRMKELGVNVIRVYQTDSKKNHDKCVKAFADNGIYLMLDIATPSNKIDMDNPTWDTDLFSAFRNKIDAFSGYDNVLGFIAGNDVASRVDNTMSAAFVKAAIRDIKGYLKANKLQFPIGYTSNHEAPNREKLNDYFVCGNDQEAMADFYGVSFYTWCSDDKFFKVFDLKKVAQEYTGSNIPVLLTEYGCFGQRPRSFSDTKALYSDDMTSVFSGGFMYMYTQEPNDYGIVDVSYGSSDLTKLAEYNSFGDVLSKANPNGVSMSSYNYSPKSVSCPSASNYWEIDPNILPPTPSTQACDCLRNSLSCNLAVADFSKVNNVDGWDIINTMGNSFDSFDLRPISCDPTNGVYGPFQFCGREAKFSWILDTYYKLSNKTAGSCGKSILTGSVVSSPSVSDLSTCAKKATDIGTPSTNNGSSTSNGDKDSNPNSSSSSSSSSSDKSPNSGNSSSQVHILSSSMAGLSVFLVTLVTLF
ncbi:hypothetical protein BB559_005357 [Furculomyces boomerangus]|uniref:1,3-beta-glucanosyltransferase n=1 Tax=Furculomyces boomerangus TaxID=61424 RepID=A0A2T9Y953_9FUNG|nr:hypothetical protein BB559_005357 [Furculomyces boomerangus]